MKKIICEYCSNEIPVDPSTGKVEEVVLIQALRNGHGTFVAACKGTCARIQKQREELLINK